MNPLLPLTRRQFLESASLIAGAAPALCALPGLALGRSTCELPAEKFPAEIDSAAPVPVVSFYVDQLYLDKSGTAAPFVPPDGARSGQAVSELSEVEFLSRHGYF